MVPSYCEPNLSIKEKMLKILYLTGAESRVADPNPGVFGRIQIYIGSDHPDLKFFKIQTFL